MCRGKFRSFLINMIHVKKGIQRNKFSILICVNLTFTHDFFRQCVFAKQILEKMGRDNRFYDKEEETGEKEGKKEWELEEEKENNMAFQVINVL